MTRRQLTNRIGSTLIALPLAAIANARQSTREEPMRYLVIFRPPSGPPPFDKTWEASVPDLPGCSIGGKNRAECEERIREAISDRIRLLRKIGRPVPPPASIAGEVEVPPIKPRFESEAEEAAAVRTPGRIDATWKPVRSKPTRKAAHAC
jgi:predicted RNase H-like HicB family nuclease